MKKAFLLCLIGLFSFGPFSACDTDDDDYVSESVKGDIKVSTTAVNFNSYSAGTATVYVTSTGDWTSNRIGAFIKYSPTSGKAGKTKVTISVGRTTSYEKGSITFRTDGDNATLHVYHRNMK